MWREAEKGRLVVAARDIAAGERVLWSRPYSYAVGDEVKEYACQNCLTDQLASGRPLGFSCEACRQVWYCSAGCWQRDALQHDLECHTLKAFMEGVDWEEAGRRTEIKLLCRTLSRRTVENRELQTARPDGAPELHFAEFEELISHRQNYAVEVVDYFLSVAAYLKSLAAWPSDMTEAAVVETMLQARHNMFNIFLNAETSLGWGVFLAASLFNHSCRPNLCYLRGEDGPGFQFIARREIKAGEELTISYLGDDDLPGRRAYLREHYFFDCACERCREDSV